jgi:hypothetical protein
MELIIVLVGILIFVSGCVLIVRPEVVIGVIEKRDESPWLYAMAIGVRAALGLLLIVLAERSRFPLTMVVLGWISIAAAVVLQALGRPRFTRFMRWIIRKVKPWARMGGLFAVLFGAFLVYAFM